MIYLASPYSHPDPAVRQQRFEAACRAAASLLRAGINVFSPIAHSHPIAGYGVPATWDFWVQVDREFLRKCEVLAVLTLDGWEQSVGVAAEIAMAQEFGMPVLYVAPGELDELRQVAIVELALEPEQPNGGTA